MKQNIVLTKSVAKSLDQVIDKLSYDSIYLLTDDNCKEYCFPLLSDELKSKVRLITITPGDSNKGIDALSYVWKILSDEGATRSSLLINLGGGVITDLGGFVAATFKRGINFINVPTTLLSAVDAAVGGKTGINFNGLKNEIGSFYSATAVLLSGEFLSTLSREELLSGYAEMLKHSLIASDDEWNKILNFDLQKLDCDLLTDLIGSSVAIKEKIVAADPFEKGIRKALNLGHTVGHAFESFAMSSSRVLPHGFAVAFGILCELYLSHKRLNFPIDKLRFTIDFVKSNFGIFPIECKSYDRLIEYMSHDKKNERGGINFTLLSDIGEIQINQVATNEEIVDMLDFYRECCS
ncbi:MAG: 3-dehydroquinate synthase [Bacteroidales bacterium]